MASCAGHPHCTQWLLQSGASLDRQDYLGDTPIHKAAKRGNMECVSLLISQGASLCLLNHSHCTPSQAAAQNGHLECAQYIENASRLQSQEQVKTMQQCVTMQPSHLVQGQMEQQVAKIPFQNDHFVDGPSPVDTEMDMAGDCPMIGMKRGRDDCCDEESFKRMRKGDTLWEINNFETASAQISNFAYIQENNNGVVCSKLFGKSYANGPIKCMGLNSHFI